MQSLETYAKELERALKRKEAFRTYNRDMHYMAETIACVFRFAEKEINLLSKTLDVAIYGDYVMRERMLEFLRKPGTKLNVLVETEIGAEHPVQQARAEFPGKVDIGIVPEALQETYEFNCMLVDAYGYWFAHNRNSPWGVASFHEEGTREMHASLVKFFGRLKERSRAFVRAESMDAEWPSNLAEGQVCRSAGRPVMGSES